MGTWSRIRFWKAALVVLAFLLPMLATQRYMAGWESRQNQLASVELRVMDADTNQPISSVEIGMKAGLPYQNGDFWETTSKPSGPPSFKGYENTDGRFVLGDIWQKQVTVFLKASGHQMASVTFHRLSRGRTRCETVKLKPAEDITGTVVDTSGKPLAGAMLFADYLPVENPGKKPSPAGLDKGRLAVTNENGEFRFPVLPVGIKRIGLFHAECVPVWESAPNYLSGSDKRVVLESYGTLEGRVLFGQQPAPPSSEVKVTVRNRSDRKTSSYTIRTGEDGRFVLHNVLPGSASVECSCYPEGTKKDHFPLRRDMKRAVDITSGRSSCCDLTFAEATSLISYKTKDPEMGLRSGNIYFCVKNPETTELAFGRISVPYGKQFAQSPLLPPGECWLRRIEKKGDRPQSLELQPNHETLVEENIQQGTASVCVNVPVAQNWDLSVTLYRGEVAIAPDEAGRWPWPGSADSASALVNELSYHIVEQCFSIPNSPRNKFESLLPGVYTLYARSRPNAKIIDPPIMAGFAVVKISSEQDAIQVTIPLTLMQGQG